MEALVVFVIALALIFDFTNGFHDSANSIATVVATRVLKPQQAVVWAAFWNFAAFFGPHMALYLGPVGKLLGTEAHVAKTVGKDLVDLELVTIYVIMAGLIGTIAWNLFTWWMGLPTSSSHALMGGYAGAAIAKAGFESLLLQGWVKPLIFIVVAPTFGLILGLILITVSSWIAYKVHPDKVNRWARRMQLFSAAIYSYAHGSNDAQKTMGIITGLLLTAGWIESFQVPTWVVLSAYSAIAMGTLFGGWRIVKTMGHGITKLRPIDGFSSETASAISILTATHLGAPVSTTHVITGAVSGVGAAKRMSAVKWDVTMRIVWAWVLTIPASAIVAWFVYKLISLFLPG